MADENTKVQMTEKQKVKEITDRLEAGLKELFESEKYKSYLSTMSKFHNYSFNNTLLIALQKPEATLVAGYKAWTTELGNEQTEEVEEYHLDVRYNMDTDELIDVKARMEQSIDTNLSVMGQAEQLINQLEAEKTIFTADERNLIVNYIVFW